MNSDFVSVILISIVCISIYLPLYLFWENRRHRRNWESRDSGPTRLNFLHKLFKNHFVNKALAGTLVLAISVFIISFSLYDPSRRQTPAANNDTPAANKDTSGGNNGPVSGLAPVPDTPNVDLPSNRSQENMATQGTIPNTDLIADTHTDGEPVASGDKRLEQQIPTSLSIVVADLANVRDLPSVESQIIYRVNKGQIVVVDEASDDWVRIRIDKGKKGWIYNELLTDFKDHDSHLVVVDDNAKIRERPSTASKVLYRIAKHRIVTLKSEKTDWYLIALDENRSGWANKDLFCGTKGCWGLPT